MRRDEGFTLVELLIVLGIVGVRVGLVAMSLEVSPPAAAETSRTAEMQTVEEAIAAYNTADVPDGAVAIPARATVRVIAAGDADAPFSRYLGETTTYSYAWGPDGRWLAQP